LSVQGRGVKTHDPVVVLQESVVQNLLSLHTLLVLTQVPVKGSQESVVHALLSLQFTPEQRFGALPPQIPKLLVEIYGQHAVLSLQVATDTPGGMI